MDQPPADNADDPHDTAAPKTDVDHEHPGRDDDELPEALRGERDRTLDSLQNLIDAYESDSTDDSADDLDDLTKDPYTTVIRTETCGKSACSCHDDEENEHGPYEYHVHTTPDGSRRWEYIGPAYET